MTLSCKRALKSFISGPDNFKQFGITTYPEHKLEHFVKTYLFFQTENLTPCSEDSGHDSDVSNSPTPPKPLLDTCPPSHVAPVSHQSSQSCPGPPIMGSVTNNNRSIFNKIFSSHLGQDRKRTQSFLTDICGEPTIKRFK